MSIDAVVREVAGDVFDQMGSGYSEAIYQCAMEVGLRLRGVAYEAQRALGLTYRDHHVGEGYADLVVRSESEAVVVELKAVGSPLGAPEEQQLAIYMRVLGIERGLLINFQQPGRAGKETRVEVREVTLTAFAVPL